MSLKSNHIQENLLIWRQQLYKENFEFSSDNFFEFNTFAQ